jgi:hypothetical protein
MWKNMKESDAIHRQQIERRNGGGGIKMSVMGRKERSDRAKTCKICP